MIIAVAIAFILCWTPFYWVNLVSQLQPTSFLRHSNFLFTMLATHLVGFLNSAIDPLIYHTMSDKFRKSFRNMLFTVFCCILPLLKKKRRYSWTTRCDGAGYAGSTLDSSNSASPHHDHVHRNRGGRGEDYVMKIVKPEHKPMSGSKSRSRTGELRRVSSPKRQPCIALYAHPVID